VKADPPTAIITLADNGERILDTFKATPLSDRTRFVPEIADAVREAARALPDGGVVLLSPAAPRGKAFKSFEERGAAFLAAAKSL
jgi:UDP-N-acetylmuramoylalanine-D-glutamate ligase